MSKTIMIIDDSATMLMSLKGTLEISGFKVETAPDGEAALGKLKAGLRPDLIITDYGLAQEETGIDLLRKIHQRGFVLEFVRFVDHQNSRHITGQQFHHLPGLGRGAGEDRARQAERQGRPGRRCP